LHPFVSDCTVADSKASSSVMAGKMPGKRAAGIDLPVPGGSTVNTLWQPARSCPPVRGFSVLPNSCLILDSCLIPDCGANALFIHTAVVMPALSRFAKGK
jgi:hypothetical protein